MGAHGRPAATLLLARCLQIAVQEVPRMGRGTMSDRLVKIFDSERESEAMVVKALLDSMGIAAEIASTDAVRQTFPGVGGTIILVAEEDADDARRAILESKRSQIALEREPDLRLEEA
jgi:hypothetical protein